MPAIIHPMAGRAGRRSRRGSRPNDATRDIPHDLKRAVGAYLQERRLALGLTQADVANALGDLWFTAVSGVENGRNAVAPERYAQWADVLDLNKREFGKFLLKHYNPYLYDLIWPGDADVVDLIKNLPERIRNAE